MSLKLTINACKPTASGALIAETVAKGYKLVEDSESQRLQAWYGGDRKGSPIFQLTYCHV